MFKLLELRLSQYPSFFAFHFRGQLQWTSSMPRHERYPHAISFVVLPLSFFRPLYIPNNLRRSSWTLRLSTNFRWFKLVSDPHFTALATRWPIHKLSIQFRGSLTSRVATLPIKFSQSRGAAEFLRPHERGAEPGFEQSHKHIFPLHCPVASRHQKDAFQIRGCTRAAISDAPEDCQHLD
ncbi:hypothetical protein DFH07DRAFT_828546 [Mycena maculata]|uniref:Uncharacterized protein n=1 Tax=Mycena maculata TaxID=230809 RepID=A0AAD7IU78_9AGAR|nr:hypothetical protein DFH07DRAFT_828546 [Mycena maculata]